MSDVSAFGSSLWSEGLIPLLDRRADEYTDILYKLWESSWRDGAPCCGFYPASVADLVRADAVVLDKARDVYAEPSRVRKINHVT